MDEIYDALAPVVEQLEEIRKLLVRVLSQLESIDGNVSGIEGNVGYIAVKA